jgi:polygalacturonase
VRHDCNRCATGGISRATTAGANSWRVQFISINDAKDVGNMGDDVIDGRGYAKLLGKDYSWWEMARKAEPKNERYFTTRMITLHNPTNIHVSVNHTNGFTA